MAGKKERQSQILDLVARNRIESQEQLLDLLAAEGVTSAQSTLSRDLRELGVVKGPAGYRPPPPGSGGPAALRRVAGGLSDGVLSADIAANLVVLKLSSPDGARALAARIDRLELPKVVIAPAMDRAVLVITRSPADAREWLRDWRRAGGRVSRSA